MSRLSVGAAARVVGASAVGSRFSRPATGCDQAQQRRPPRRTTAAAAAHCGGSELSGVAARSAERAGARERGFGGRSPGPPVARGSADRPARGSASQSARCSSSDLPVIGRQRRRRRTPRSRARPGRRVRVPGSVRRVRCSTGKAGRRGSCTPHGIGTAGAVCADTGSSGSTLIHGHVMAFCGRRGRGTDS